jgi:uncharacterized repeat protein (TIGR03803 family)
MVKLRNIVWAGWTAFVMAASLSGTAHAASTETIIHNFANPTGSVPTTGPVIDASTGAFYGAMETGGTNRTGVVYQLLPPTATQPKWTYTVIYNNPAGTQSPARVGVNIYASKGVVYGFAGAGFLSLTPPASGVGDWTPTVLYNLTGSDGSDVEGPLTMDGKGAIYGTAFAGGKGCPSEGGCGTVFKLTPPAADGQPWSFAVAYYFPGGATGEKPSSGVIFDKGGNLYGSAAYAYPSTYKSLVFKLTPPAGAGEWTESVLHHFDPTSGCYSSGPLAIDGNGALYGTGNVFAEQGVQTCRDGSTEYVFQLAPSSSNRSIWTETVMRSFPYTNPPGAGGYRLTAPVTVDASGNVYGTTYSGGSSDTGTVFILEPRAGVPGKWNYKTLLDFAALSTTVSDVNKTGSNPNGGLVFDAAGYIYGTAFGGGSWGRGAFFRLTK